LIFLLFIFIIRCADAFGTTSLVLDKYPEKFLQETLSCLAKAKIFDTVALFSLTDEDFDSTCNSKIPKKFVELKLIRQTIKNAMPVAEKKNGGLGTH
jgi:hypothetical protein